MNGLQCVVVWVPWPKCSYYAFTESRDNQWVAVLSQSDNSVVYLPVHAEGAQVENRDAHWGFLQEGHQLAQAEAKGSVVKGEARRQELIKQKQKVWDYF